jgi:hypothetical protein
VHVIGHPAIGPDLDAVFGAGFRKPISVERVILFGKEDPLATIAALGQVMRDPRQNDASNLRYAPARYEVRFVNTGLSMQYLSP